MRKAKGTYVVLSVEFVFSVDDEVFSYNVDDLLGMSPVVVALLVDASAFTPAVGRSLTGEVDEAMKLMIIKHQQTSAKQLSHLIHCSSWAEQKLVSLLVMLVLQYSL